MYLDQLEEVLTFSVPKGKIAGFFAEAIQVAMLLIVNQEFRLVIPRCTVIQKQCHHKHFKIFYSEVSFYFHVLRYFVSILYYSPKIILKNWEGGLKCILFNKMDLN